MKFHQEWKKYTKFIDRILALSKYHLNATIDQEIVEIFTYYFINNSNVFFNHMQDGQEVGVIFGNIDYADEVAFDYDKLTLIGEQHPEYKEITTLQMEINKIMEAHYEPEIPELVTFCSFIPGVGSQLIKQWEAEVKARGYHQYYLFTDSNCTYEWYIKKGYTLLEQYPINLDNLPTIKAVNKEFYVYKFLKQI